MGKVAAFIPIKTNSTRAPGKNFRVLNGKPLYQHIIDHAIEANCFDCIYIDSDSEEILDYADTNYLQLIERDPELAKDTANGNDLLWNHYQRYPEYVLYFQLFATAPFLKPKTIRDCVETLTDWGSFFRSELDSICTATHEKGWFWKTSNTPLYRPDILPRSQDAGYLIKETTGLYGVTREALEKYKCRIGANPYFIPVDKVEAMDLDTEEDFKLAEVLCELQ